VDSTPIVGGQITGELAVIDDGLAVEVGDSGAIDGGVCGKGAVGNLGVAGEDVGGATLVCGVAGKDAIDDEGTAGLAEHSSALRMIAAGYGESGEDGIDPFSTVEGDDAGILVCAVDDSGGDDEGVGGVGALEVDRPVVEVEGFGIGAGGDDDDITICGSIDGLLNGSDAAGDIDNACAGVR